MRKQILIRLLCLLCLVGVCLVGAAYAQNTATLTAQEALFPAVANNRGTVNWSQLFAATGIDRTNEPVTVGIPLPNAWQVLESDTSRAVSFTGTNGIWQTKCEAHWTSGYCKWLLIDAQLPSVTHDSTNTTFTLSTSGTGPTSGQAALAVDSNPGAPNTGTITVTTGTGTVFTIRKASFNLFDIVTVGGTPLVATNTSDGLVVSGPVYPATTCSSPATDCTTEYKSSLDSASTAVLERNGPALAIVKADGALKDSGAHTYLRYTVRLTFYAGKSYVSTRVILRNADDATGAGSFASAFKGIASWEARVKLVSLSSPVAKFSTASSSVTHNMQAGEDAYLYQAYSTAFYDGDGESNNWKNPPITRTSLGSGANGDYIWAQNGWLANYGTSGSYTLIPGGSGPITDHNHDWADIADSAGKGVLMGAYYSTAYWPKSFGYFGGGTEARIGMFPNQGLYTGTCAASPCRIPWYQPWPQYKIDDVYFNFHASAIAAPDAEFMKWQQRLLARATVDHYNSTGAFAYSLISSADMDTYTTDLVNNANPAGYLGGWLASKHSIDFMPGVFFVWPWSRGSQGNQTDFREQYLKQFWQHGFTGRYLWAENFNRYLLEEAFPRADFAGGWRSHAFTDVDLRSNPSKVSSANNNLSNGGLAYGDRDNYWIDAGNGDIHGHTYGIFDWYLATGDQTYLDFIRQAQVDAYLNTASTLYAPPFTSSGVTIPRQWGIRAIHAARMVEFFDSIGDTATANLAKTFGDNLAALVTGDVQLSGTGANTHGTDTLMGYALPIYGTSRTRGEVLLDWGGNYTGITAGHTNYQTECNAYEDGNLGGTYATTSNVPYQTSMMVQGVKELAWIRGPSWANYKLLRDLAYGWAKSSTANHQGMEDTGDWSTGGIRYGYPFNHTCNPNGPICPCQATYGARATVWMLWDYLWDYEGSTSGKSGFDLVLRKYMAVFPPASNTEWGQWGMSSTMYHYLHPTTTVASPAGVTTGLAMSTVSPLTVTNNGGGSYSLSFPAVSGATYAVKHASGKQIVDWLNFDIRYNNGTNNDCTVNVAPLTEACGTWGVDPTTHATWFGSNYTKEQTVSCPGSTCSITVTQDAANTALPSTGEQFMVKAFSGSGSPPPTDTTAPTVTITGPAPGNVSGTVSVTATATDPDDAVAGVQFKLDGVNLGAEDTSSPYSASWDTTTAVNGNHILSAVARDTNGNQNTATLAVVVVNNSGGGASATWTQICSGSTGPHPCPAPTWPYMRGYNYNLPYAPTRGTVLYYGGAGGGSSIYSNAVWEYNSNTHTANRISWTGTTDYVCNNIAGGGNGGSGSYGQFTAAPYFDGHPMGWFEVDTTRNQFFITGLLCQGYQMHHTWLLNLGNLTWSEAGSGIYPADITDSASIFVPWADVFISFGGAYGGSISNKLYYFHPASNTWTDETSGQTGIPNSGIGMVSGKFAADVANHVLYYFGGCKASDCSVGPFNTDIYTFNVATKAWTKLNPTGAGPAQGWQAPIWVWDSLRSRLITFSEGNVYAYTPSTNAWTPISTNAGPTTYAHSTSMGWNPSTEAQYDPGTDKVIFFDNAAVHGSLSGGGNADTPAIYELALGTGGGTTAYMVSVTIAGTGSGTVSDGLGFVCSSGTCGQQYNQGSNVTLTATATEGGSFAGWSGVDGGACPAGNTCTFNNLNAAKSVTATFNRPATAIRYSGVTVQGVKIQ